ncbi:MAG: S41 family peptidase [Ferruginibacter sp.]
MHRNLLLAFFIVGCIGKLHAQNIRVINAAFEEGDTSLTGWIFKKSGKAVTVKKDNFLPYRGGYSMMLSSAGREDDRGCHQKIYIQPSPVDRQIYFSCAVRMKPGSIADVYAVFLKQKQRTGESVLSYSYIEDSVWKIYENRELLPAGTDSIVINIIVKGASTGWFDDVHLEIPNTLKRPPAALKKILANVFKWAKNNYWKRDSVDWAAVKRKMIFMEAGALNNQDYYPSLRAMLPEIHDPHGHIITAEQHRQGKAAVVTSPDYKPRLPYAKMVDNDYVYLHIPQCFTYHPSLRKQYADTLLTQIKLLDSLHHLKGWIVDIRDNGGGFCDPMIAALSPVYGPGFMCGTQFFDKKNYGKRDSTFWIPADGKYFFFDIKPYWPQNDLPVAVLSGPRTGSSGEIVLIGFMHHPRAKVFGEPSGGVPTGPEPYDLPDGGSFSLSASVRFDRGGVNYGSHINPDVFVLNPENIRDMKTDPVILAAKAWLGSKTN